MIKNQEIFQVNFTDNDEARQIIDLLKCAFPTTTYFSMEWWSWKYLSIPNLKPKGWSIRDTKTNQIVAIRLFWPFILKNNKMDNLGYQPVDTATHPSFRGKGLFSLLIKHSLNEFKSINPILFNFPNNQSLIANLKNGWNLHSANQWVSTIMKPTLKGKFLDIFQINNDTLISPIEYEEEGTFVKWDQHTIRWRFGNHPVNKYFIAQNELGYAIFKQDFIFSIPVTKILLARYTSSLFLIHLFNTLTHYKFRIIGYNGLNKDLINVMKAFSLYSHNHGNANYAINNLTQINVEKPLFEIGDSDFM